MKLSEAVRQSLRDDKPMSVHECYIRVKLFVKGAMLESVHAELARQYKNQEIRRISRGMYQKRKFL